MEFENKLIPGTLIKRYKRFFVDIKLNNKIVTAHCPNTGSMMGLLKKGNKVWVTKSNNIKRKLRYTLHKATFLIMMMFLEFYCNYPVKMGNYLIPHF